MTVFGNGDYVRQLRLVTGLILFTFAFFHLLNHALGLVSIDAMEAMRQVRIAITRNWLGTAILLFSSFTHAILGLSKFLNRRTWKMTWEQGWQLASGLLIPLLMLRHVTGMRGANELFGVDDDYIYALFALWPSEALNQTLLISLVWIHSCVGLYFWLRLKPWFKNYSGYLYAIAIMLPVLSFAGFSSAGRMVRMLYEFENPFQPGQIEQLKQLMKTNVSVYAAILASAIGFRLARTVYDWMRTTVKVSYVNGPTVTPAPGQTLLETSHSFNIPHASICGGKARCSTCRVRVLDGLDGLEPPDQVEQKVLERIGAMPNVRLACQLRPCNDINIVPLLPAKKVNAGGIEEVDKYFWGVEHKVTLLFADLRGFTRISEDQLPYDVVFMLNQYLGRMSEVIEDAGGYVDKFMGDGIMAIFGMDEPANKGARQAMIAARSMSGVLDSLNMSLSGELPDKLNIGIGIHTGEAILGRIGVSSQSGAGERITALGDTVNTASRLETATKEFAAQLIISQVTRQMAGVVKPESGEQQIMVKGRSKPVCIYVWNRATDVEFADISTE